MAIRDIVTRGFGNGTYSGSIPLVVTRGFAIGEVVIPNIAFVEMQISIEPSVRFSSISLEPAVRLTVEMNG